MRVKVAVAVLCALSLGVGTAVFSQTQRESVPAFRLDSSWPQPLPNNWALGMISSLTADSRDHIWVLHRPSTLSAEDLKSKGKTAAPPVIEFDQDGKVVQAWGGPGPGYDWMAPVNPKDTSFYPAPENGEHGIYVDDDNVWLSGSGQVVLKFTRAGKFLLQIGQYRKNGGSNDQRTLGKPTDVAVDRRANEVFVSDGYVNRRVIVFDSNTGAYKRHWGAYGEKPDDGEPALFEPSKPMPRQFFIVHCIVMSKDGLLYVCDRQRNRIQVFRKDGTFVQEGIVDQAAPAGAGITLKGPSAVVAKAGMGSVNRVAFSGDPQQQYIYAAVISESKVIILRRSDLKEIGSFKVGGTHNIATDSKGNVYSTGQEKPERFLLIKESGSAR